MAQDEAFGDALGQRAAVSPYPLVDRLQRLEMRSASGGGDAHHVTDEVVNGYEHRGHSLQPGGDLGGVGTPHAVRALRDEAPIVARPVRGLQPVFPHQAPHPFLRGRNIPMPQPRPHLAIALAPKAQGLRLTQHLADSLRHLLVRQHRLATPLPARNRSFGGCLPRIMRGAGQAPQPTHPDLAIDTPRGNRAGPAHGFDLRFPKGGSPSKRAMRISRSSLSIIRSPTRRLARLSCRSKAATLGSSVRRFKAARPPSRNSSRHWDNTEAGCPVSQLSYARPTSVSRTSRSWTPPVAHSTTNWVSSLFGGYPEIINCVPNTPATCPRPWCIRSSPHPCGRPGSFLPGRGQDENRWS